MSAIRFNAAFCKPENPNKIALPIESSEVLFTIKESLTVLVVTNLSADATLFVVLFKNLVLSTNKGLPPVDQPL